MKFSYVLLVLLSFTTATMGYVEHKLVPSVGNVADNFGISVAMDGDWAAVGMHGDDTQGSDSGSVWIYHYNGASWNESQVLYASDGQAGDLFGISLSLENDGLLVGAIGDSTNGAGSGSIYVFYLNGETWSEGHKLLPDDGEAGDGFGISVFLSINTVVVGAYLDDDNGINAGSAYVFKYSGGWDQEAKLLAGDGQAGDNFGYATSIYGDDIVVGAGEDDDQGLDAGSAYVFHRSGSSWSQTTKLLASDGWENNHFGIACSIFGDFICVGAYRGNSNTGCAYMYGRNGGAWDDERILVAGDADTDDRFGISVSLEADYALIGSWHDDVGGMNRTGSAYEYLFDGYHWIEMQKFIPTDGEENDEFGVSVCTNATRAIVGAWLEDEVNNNCGAAYIFDGAPMPIPSTGFFGGALLLFLFSCLLGTRYFFRS